MHFQFPAAPRCVPDVLNVEAVTHGYGGERLFENIDIVLERGDRVAIVGPNGAGKSTLFRLLCGLEAPNQGKVFFGGESVAMQYFEQDQANTLDLRQTVLQCLRSAASADVNDEQLRGLLGKFMFKGDSVHKQLSKLSGGEKARVALCRILLTPCNLLIMDEPTNHLDIAAKEVLEQALQNFGGTLVLISHDRYFLSQTATTICALEDRQLEVYPGDYKYYMQRHQDVKQMVEGRYIEGFKTIESAPEMRANLEQEQPQKKKKNFGGKGPSGNKNKGVKNAKRYQGV